MTSDNPKNPAEHISPTINNLEAHTEHVSAWIEPQDDDNDIDYCQVRDFDEVPDWVNGGG